MWASMTATQALPLSLLRRGVQPGQHRAATATNTSPTAEQTAAQIQDELTERDHKGSQLTQELQRCQHELENSRSQISVLKAEQDKAQAERDAADQFTRELQRR